MKLPNADPLTTTDAVADNNAWPLTIATYNIHGAVGTDGHFAPQRIVEVVKEVGADIVALQEVPLGGGGFPDVLQMLQDATGFEAVEGPTFKVGERIFGNAVLSRYPILAKRSLDLSVGKHEPRGALDADVSCHGHPLRVVATHLGLRPAERRWQIQRLLQTFDTDQMPVILLGDINEWFVWGRPLRWLVSHFESVPAPKTFPSRWPLFALDRIWIRPRHRLVHVDVHATPLARVASDHLPLIAHING
ncbi:endonuclease/exonuclease/phosphatase family protein [Janthinobacterium sp. 17J80-10]|uniref:endonuclease/exonuclease/phosphatase family protein n=1 Tax=Janthinobacterium sp. 17J80-10 TaxID=2497863 RepID=UPI00100568B0|nr:endonuclease/exonuclease/phosphatase family protein [Janthinobacterium sp. 17J80-10]QAU34915.1 endonuclease [Janthinobacterium sp. 17J80-10]